MKKKLRKIWSWLDDRGHFSEIVKPLKTHLVPPGTKWNYVWGSATLFCLVIQVVTGIALSFLYQPSVSSAFESLQYIENEAFLGSFIRGLHSWGASGMIVLMGVHLIRVYLFAAYKYPREMNWISGVILFGLTVSMAFTGQLLRWDSNGVWTAILGAEQIGRIPFVGDALAYFVIGGNTMGGDTLNRFFSFHVFLLPGILFLIVGFHLFLVFKNGISEPPKAGRLVNPKKYREWYKDLLKNKGVPFFPDVMWRDVVFSGIVLLAVAALGYYVGGPKLSHPPDPTFLEVEPKPDWYFEWIYAIFATMNRHLEPYFLFFAPVLAGIILFAVPFLSNGGERSPKRRPWAVAAVVFFAGSILSLTYVGLRSPWVPKFKAGEVSAYQIVPEANSQVQKGVQVFNDMHCVYCHKMGKKGGQAGPNLTTVNERLTPEQITIRIANGTDDMPAFGGSLTNDEMAALVAFLSSEKETEKTTKEKKRK